MSKLRADEYGGAPVATLIGIWIPAGGVWAGVGFGEIEGIGVVVGAMISAVNPWEGDKFPMASTA
jgi:hypothetical protein